MHFLSACKQFVDQHSNKAARALGLAAAALMLASCGGAGESSAPAAAPVYKALTVGGEPQVGSSSSAFITVVALEKVSETRVSRTVFDYAFKATVRNAGVAQGGVVVTLAAAGPGSTVLGGVLEAGMMEAGATTVPAAMIVIRHDRTRPFSLAALKFDVTTTGPVVPPRGTEQADGTLLGGVAVLSAAQAGRLTGETADTLQFTGEVDAAPGTVMVVNGSAYKVVSKTYKDGVTVIGHIAPRIDEIFSRVRITGNYDVADQQATPPAPVLLASTAMKASAAPAVATFTHTASLGDGPVTGTASSSGTLTLALDYDYDAARGGLVGAKMSALASVDSSVTMTAKAKASLSRDLASKAFFIPINFTIYDALANRLGAEVAGIYIRVSALVTADAQLESTATLTSRLAGSATTVYSNGAFSTSFLPQASGTGQFSNITATSTDVEAVQLGFYLNVRPALSVLKRVALAGMDLRAGPRADLEAKRVADRIPDFCATAKVYAHAEASFFFKTVGSSERTSEALGYDKLLAALDPIGSCLAPTTVQFVSLAGPSPAPWFGQKIVARVKVLPVAGQSVPNQWPTGAVSVSSGDQQCLTVIAADGSGQCELAAGSAGAATLFTAKYAGDSIYEKSETGAQRAIDKSAVFMTLQSSHSTVGTQGAVTFTSVAGPKPELGQKLPTGNVTFKTGAGATLCSAALDGAGTAACAARVGVAGQHAVTAHYAGDPNYLTASSSAVAILVTADVVSLQVDPAGSWTVEVGVPAGFPLTKPPLSWPLADGGFKPGDVIEVRELGYWYYAGYWGGGETSTGAAGLFTGAGGYLPPAQVLASDPGVVEPVGPDLTIYQCHSNTALDIPQDFAIANASWRRVKIPPGATHLLLGVSDCYHGDNTGIVTVEVRAAGSGQ